MTSQTIKRSRAAQFMLEVLGATNSGVSQVFETHISWVFLTERFAYKLKKPVQFDFLDFSTVDYRKEACQNEVALNRRLSPNVYLGVVPITEDKRHRLHLGGEGQPIDWVVKMRRLDERQTLEARIADQSVSPDDIALVAAKLAGFYVNQAPVTIRTDVYRNRIRNHVIANRRDLLQHLPTAADTIQRTHAAQQRFLQVHAETINDRVCDGRIVDGHGDLRPEHIYLRPEPVVIDCIEFNTEYRQNDIVDDLGFLGMECHRLHASWVGDLMLSAYRDLSGDDPPDSLVAFYKCYRACVRAKVAALRGQRSNHQTQCQASQDAKQYLEIAQYYTQQLGPPLMLLVGGLMGTGKSTLAENAADALAAELLQTDLIRKELFSDKAMDAAFGNGKYSREGRRRVYEEMVRRAESLLERNVTIVLDGTFSSAACRQIVMKTAKRAGATCLQVQCCCPREVALARIVERSSRGTSASEARPDLYDEQAREYAPLDKGSAVLQVDTTQPVNVQTQQIVKRIRGLGSEKHLVACVSETAKT